MHDDVPQNVNWNIKYMCASIGGIFAHRAHSANYYTVYPGNTPENHPPTEACMLNSNTGEAGFSFPGRGV